MKKLYIIITSVLMILSGCSPEDGTYTLKIISTNDVHGSWFDEDYVTGEQSASLTAINSYVDSIRKAEGPENVILIDAGDCLQGDNASYYYNYIVPEKAHLFPRIAAYMGYDAIIVGNHDIETGHNIYDKVRKELESEGIPFLAGNAIRTDSGKPYFQPYTILRKNGLKVAILGYTNANIKAWLNESLWEGLDFKSLIPAVQEDVNKVIAKEKPQVVIVAVHSGTGDGEGNVLESQALDLYNSLEGVDLLIGAHDHRPYCISDSSFSYINAGNAARNFGLSTIRITIEDGKVSSKTTESSLVAADPGNASQSMKEKFKEDYDAVKAFTMKEVGKLEKDMRTSDSFVGMCDYINLLHTVSLGCSPAQISIAAPLTMNQTIKAGTLIYDDMFKIYRFENQLFVVRMSGQELKDFLEYSYNLWIQTASSPEDHILRIIPREDARAGTKKWSFDKASYNFDSAAGINYTVDVTKDYGDRVCISTLADGSEFNFDEQYNVAMTSYRASGGGGAMTEGAGIDTSTIDERVVAKYPEIRDLIYQFITQNGTITPELIAGPQLGHWNFVPENICGPALERDWNLMFRNN